jgi:hypothetical protein
MALAIGGHSLAKATRNLRKGGLNLYRGGYSTTDAGNVPSVYHLSTKRIAPTPRGRPTQLNGSIASRRRKNGGNARREFARIVALTRAKLTDVRVELEADPKGFGKPLGSLLIHLARATELSIIPRDPVRSSDFSRLRLQRTTEVVTTNKAHSSDKEPLMSAPATRADALNSHRRPRF